MRSVRSLIIVLSFILFAKSINAQSVGGTTTGEATYCSGSNSGFMGIFGHTGTIIGWEESTDNGTTWISTRNTFSNQSYFNLSVTTCYRVLVQSGAFPPDTSTISCISIFIVATPQITQTGDTLISSPATSYQWFMNGNILTNQTNQTLIINQNGNYTVQIQDGSVCSASSADYSVTSLEVKESYYLAKANYYPNPTTGLFHIELPLDPGLEYAIGISDLVGKIIMKEKITGSTSFSEQLDLSKLQAGVYLLSIEGSDKTKIVQRVVLNN